MSWRGRSPEILNPQQVTSETVFEFATLPDLLRLLVLPGFGYVAWRDIKTRRVPNETWYPFAVLGLVLLAWELYTITTGDVSGFRRQNFLIRTAISVGFLIPLSYLFWLLGGFGGADAKAFFIVALLFPTYPEYTLSAFGVEGALATLPVVSTEVGVFSMTVLSNTVLLGALYPVALAVKNAASGYVSPGMFVAKPIRWDDATEEYGTMLDFAERGLTDDLSLSGVRSYFRWRSLDLDALRMYLQWRGCSLGDLRENPERLRDPDSLPEEPNQPGDGSIATDGGTPAEEAAYDDPWGAEAFLEETNAYGTTPATLRAGLETLSSDDIIWISPGIPFLVPLFVGVVVAFTFGDLLFALLGLTGLV
jgi:preflagellin peptidase FlaK